MKYYFPAHTVCIFSLAALLAGCSNPKKEAPEDTRIHTEVVLTDPPSIYRIDQLDWLIGTWHNPGKKSIMVEEWKKENDSTYTGSSYMVSGKDTTLLETLSMEERGGELYYVPTVINQNERKPVRFRLTSSYESPEFIFENPEHDFPQKITYRQVNNDSLMAEISGISKGKQKTVPFPMKRVK